MELKKTSLYEKHLEHKAKIVDFGGWAMPVEYGSVLKEAKLVRSGCGLFDASHMGEIRIAGPGALAFLQELTCNDISCIRAGQMQYNLFLNGRGGIIDDLMVYHCGDSFLCVVNASNAQKVLAWLLKRKISVLTVNDESAETSLLSLQGPAACSVIEKLFPQAQALQYMHFLHASHNDKKILISRSGYTGEDGFEIYCDNTSAVNLWDALLLAGRAAGCAPCGLGSRDILRIEAGYTLYGHEIDEDTNPLEASLDWAVKFQKNFVGKGMLLEAKIKGLSKKRVGFIMDERAIPRQGYPVYADGRIIGVVSSGTFSPTLNKGIGMAYIESAWVQAQPEITIKIRDAFYKATITKFNFVKGSAKK
ncbi:MAG: glycine cleavage system aminomethyltransferase GcvT [Candidatus Omnitrophota bacterium]|nr:glycine cleavage system aminomethyltransferase GcvT [Candidatus Omnitrophota bacterium]